MIRYFDVFNGDADGLCALHQLRLAEPREAELVTGAKRDIELLARVTAQAGDEVTVLDVSLYSNRAPLMRLLDGGVRVRYFDHHHAGDVPEHPGLEAHLDTQSGVCTSLIVDRILGGRFRAWAVVAAFGDNLAAAAERAAAPLLLAPGRLARLRELGVLLNYNAYGHSVADLWFDPAELVRELGAFSDPFEFIAGHAAFARLAQGYAEDLARVGELEPLAQSKIAAIYLLPQAAWSRRISGTFANQLANESPLLAHAVLTPRADGALRVSVRAPRGSASSAEALCREFPSGGGRREAAGINALPADQTESFCATYMRYFS